MQKSNRILSFLLALVMVFTIVPATVFAQGETDVLEGWSITLGDDIGVNFYLNSADYTVTATVNGAAVTPTICENVATVNVAAAQMTDPIVLTVKDADQVVHTGKYTVRQYADTILNGSYDAKVKDMVKQMLNYGAASQTYFNHNIKTLANKGITVPEVAMPAENPQVSITDNLDGIALHGASLVLRNKTAVRFYFQVTGDISSFTFSQGTPVLKNDLYYIEIDGINPQNYADNITLSVNDGALSVTYSPLAYITRKYNHAESANALKALMQAMYGYHLEAIAYQQHLETEHADGHTWLDATCMEPKTCSMCGAKEGTVSDHSYADGICQICGIPQVIRTQWDMSSKKDAADWTGYHSKTKNEALTTTVTEDGFTVDYLDPGNGWKGIVLEKTLIDISKLTGKLTFTYSSDMAITNYRIHILTGLGGNLTANGTADCYADVSIADITAGKLEAWTQTANEDGSVTATFDLSSMGYFTNGTMLHGLTIVTVTANKTPGTVTYKSIALELDLEGHDCQIDGHMMKEATCTAPKTCYACGTTEGEPLGHAWVDATCTEPKTCSVCCLTEGEALGHSWADATCTEPKTCSACGVTEGEPLGHTWVDATCTAPKTCSVCSATEGKKLAHTDADGDLVCDVCTDDMTIWNMNNPSDAIDWTGYHAMKKNEALTTVVTDDGLVVDYQGSGNGWKGIVLEDTAINISKLTGKLTFTYNSDLAITSYRIHILTDLGGDLTTKGDADYYTSATIADITTGNLAAWTQTENEDGTVTVTFDLSSMAYFANGTQLTGLTIVTVTANKVTGTVTYKSIELEKIPQGYNCQIDGHIMKDATCTEPATCSVCGATEGEALGHAWVDATCTAPKTCSVCDVTEGEPLGHSWADATCTEPKTCTACGAVEGEKLGHMDADNDLVCDVCTDDLAIWNMNNPADAIDWTGYQSQKPNEKLTTTVTDMGLEVNYLSPGNGWKAIVLEEAAMDISKLTGKLTFTYSTDMAIANYRIHILTDLGGNLTANGTADCYARANIADIIAGNLEAWTQTTNEDGSVTVTFDLSSMAYFTNGTQLQGLTIVTATANGVTGTVTYKSIELEKIPEGYNCQIDGHIMKDATCTEPATCSVCGATEGEALGHAWVNATCTEPKICSVCDVTEGEALGHAWADATCTAPKTCSCCGITEGTAAGHSFVEGVCSACGTTEAVLATPVVWNMSQQADASQWYSAQAYTSTKPSVTTSEITDAGFVVNYFHKNGWKGIVLENVEIDITGLSGLLSFTYTEEMDITAYRIHILTDRGGDLGSNTSGTPSDYYVAVAISDIAASTTWTRTENADGTITVTFDLSTLPFFAEGTVLMGMDIVTATATGTTGTVTYKSIEIR